MEPRTRLCRILWCDDSVVISHLLHNGWSHPGRALPPCSTQYNIWRDNIRHLARCHHSPRNLDVGAPHAVAVDHVFLEADPGVPGPEPAGPPLRILQGRISGRVLSQLCLGLSGVWGLVVGHRDLEGHVVWYGRAAFVDSGVSGVGGSSLGVDRRQASTELPILPCDSDERQNIGFSVVSPILGRGVSD